jgi:hypothetical protein
MFRRTNAAFQRMKAERERRVEEKNTTTKSTIKTAKLSKPKTTSAKLSSTSTTSTTGNTKTKTKNDDTDNFLEWQANEKRKNNITKKKLHRGGAPLQNDDKVSFREMLHEPETHLLICLVLGLDFFCYLFVIWYDAATSEEGGLPEAARQELVESNGIHIMFSVSKWLSIFAVFMYFMEQLVHLIFDGLRIHFLSLNAIDVILWLISTILMFYNAAHYRLFNVLRVAYRIYVVCAIYIHRATLSTNYYQKKYIKMLTIIKKQRKQMIDMNDNNNHMKKEIDNHRNHISELERALLIAAESEAVRMDLGTLTQYAAEGSKNTEEFSY